MERTGLPVKNYYASEIKKTALKVSEFNYPGIIQLGDIKNHFIWDIPDEIDLLFAGPPCQDLSAAMKNRKGLDGEKSSLFFVSLEILKKYKPTYFLFENVGRMKKEDREIISEKLGVSPIRINSKLVSAQLRDRLYWTNIPDVQQPEDKKIELQDILESGFTDRKKARSLLASDSRPLRDKKKMIKRYYKTGFTTLVFEDKEMSPENCRYFTQIELERLQTLPVGYTQVLKRNEAAHCIGDSWTVDVISHFLKQLKEF